MKAFVTHIIVYGVQLATIVLLRLRLVQLNVLKRRNQIPTSVTFAGDVAVSNLGMILSDC